MRGIGAGQWGGKVNTLGSYWSSVREHQTRNRDKFKPKMLFIDGDEFTSNQVSNGTVRVMMSR